MFARSMTIHGNPEALEAGIAYIRDEAMRELLAIEGCTGLSMLADRTFGMSIVTTAWRDAESMAAALHTVRPMWDRSTEVMGGLAEIDEWEIAVLHRRHHTPDGAASRVTWVQTSPDRVDDVVDTFRMALAPQLEGLPGFCSVSLLVDRKTGRGAVSFTVESAAALQRTRDQGGALRETFVERMGVDVTDMAEFDLVLAHLGVPETV
jgi:hypothetical protein